jgi:uncharacterized protein YbjQ (UPF0145 family)
MAADDDYWTISVRWGRSIYRDAPEHIRDYLDGRYVSNDAAYHAAQIVTQWARIRTGRVKMSYHPATPSTKAYQEPYWTVSVRAGRSIYRDAPEHIRETLTGRYSTYNRAHEAATLVTSWARIPFERAAIVGHDPKR